VSPTAEIVTVVFGGGGVVVVVDVLEPPGRETPGVTCDVVAVAAECAPGPPRSDRYVTRATAKSSTTRTARATLRRRRVCRRRIARRWP
jgi:hypothetical protein